MTNAYKIAQQYVGQCVDFDGAYGYQCVDIVNQVASHYGFFMAGEGAKDLGLANDFSSFADVIPYSSGMTLNVGDIITTREPSGIGWQYGHVFVYGGGDLSNALVIEQNYQGACTVEHRRAVTGYGNTLLNVIRIKGQDNYSPADADGALVGNAKETEKTIARDFFEIICDVVEGVKSPSDSTTVETFFKCNKVSGKINGEWLIYDKYDGSVAYIPVSCVKKLDDYSTTPKKEDKKKYQTPNGYDSFPDKTSDGLDQSGTQKIYSLAQLISLGRIKEANFEWTYPSGSSFPKNVKVLGLGYNAYGFLSDGDGNIILSAPKAYGEVIGATYNTPFGFKGKVYTKNDKTSFDVYVR